MSVNNQTTFEGWAEMWGILFCIGFLSITASVIWSLGQQKIRCTFDRNEIGPIGSHGQWYWEIYKCSDGTERRELVAGPRG